MRLQRLATLIHPKYTHYQSLVLEDPVLALLLPLDLRDLTMVICVCYMHTADSQRHHFGAHREGFF